MIQKLIYDDYTDEEAFNLLLEIRALLKEPGPKIEPEWKISGQRDFYNSSYTCWEEDLAKQEVNYLKRCDFTNIQVLYREFSKSEFKEVEL
jgi:hypothetical protein